MNRNSNPTRVSRSGLLLTETLIAILFFSIASAVCLQLFGKTHSLSQRSHLLDTAVAQTNSVAGLLNASQLSSDDSDDVYAFLTEFYPQALKDGDAIRLYYNSELNPCGKDEACYLLTIRPSVSGKLTDYSMEMLILSPEESENESVYRIHVTVYRPYDKEVD